MNQTDKINALTKLAQENAPTSQTQTKKTLPQKTLPKPQPQGFSETWAQWVQPPVPEHVTPPDWAHTEATAISAPEVTPPPSLHGARPRPGQYQYSRGGRPYKYVKH